MKLKINSNYSLAKKMSRKLKYERTDMITECERDNTMTTIVNEYKNAHCNSRY